MRKRVEQVESLHLLNQEEIAARRIPLEDAEIRTTKNKWHCSFCEKRFAGENAFLKHYCEPRRRREELLSPLGQAAYSYYRDWMKMKKYSQPSAAAFMDSRYYRSFINFAQLVIDANISRPDKYMEIMLEGDVLPILWCREQCYSAYLQWSDKREDPIDQVQESINYLLDICERESVEISKVANHLGPQQIISLVRQRRLTPWLIFCSATFCDVIRTFDSSHQSVFAKIVNTLYWRSKFESEVKTLESVKQIIKEIGL